MLRRRTNMGLILGIAGVMAFFLWVPASFADGFAFTDVELFTDNRCSACPLPGFDIHFFTEFHDPFGLGDIISGSITPINGNLPPITPVVSSVGNNNFDVEAIFPNNNYSGTYQITANTLSSGTVTINTHTLDHPQQLPFLTNFSIDNNGTTPTVHFTMPSVTPHDGYLISERVDVVQNGNVIFRSPLFFLSAGDQGSFTIPDGVLTVGDTYFIRGDVREVEQPNIDPVVFSIENRSIVGDANFLVTPEPSSLALMSSAVPGLLGYAWLRRRKATEGS